MEELSLDCHANDNTSPRATQIISVLHIEDDDFDAALVHRNLERCDYAAFSITHERTLSEGLYWLSDHRFDVILLDPHLPDCQGLATVRQCHNSARDTPLVILTGNETEDTPAEFIELGVQDLIPKTTLDGNILHHAIRYAIVRKEQEIHFKSNSEHDELTGLLTPQIMHDRIAHSILRHRRSQTKLAVLYLDIHDFKGINNTFGHAAGDLVLKQIANSLQEEVRKGDSIARMDGDEFAVLIESLQSLKNLETIINKILKDACAPITVNGEKIYTQLSIGVSTYDGRSIDSTTNAVSQADTLLEQANFCMYQAKQDPGSQYTIFDKALRAEQHTRKALTQLNEKCFDRSQFRVSYAPIIAAKTNDLHGAKAQLIWLHRANEHLLTADLLSIVERLSVARTIGEWFLQEAISEWKTYVCHNSDGRRYKDKFSYTPKLFINLPSKFLYDHRALSTIEKCLTRFKLDARYLVLEMHGQDVVNHLSFAVEMACICRNQLGVSVCLSDFGSYACSLALLQEVPCDYLRLSGCFFEHPERANHGMIIAEETQRLAKRLGLSVLAPDNCSAKQRAQLAEMGFPLFQERD